MISGSFAPNQSNRQGCPIWYDFLSFRPDEHPNGHLGHFSHRLADRCNSRRRKRSNTAVIKAYQPYLLRYLYSSFAADLDNLSGNDVTAGKNSVNLRKLRQNFSI